MSLSKPALSIILPFRNQASYAARVLEAYRSTFDRFEHGYELLVVPNGCTDGTRAVVEAFARDCTAVRLVECPRGGWGLAVRLGMEHARGDVLCYTNSARTDPRHILELFALHQRQSPCLAKVRRYRRRALFRELGSWLYNFEARLIFGLTPADVNGTPKMLARELADALQLQTDDDLLDLELMVKVHRLGVPVAELPVSGFHRHGGRSSTNLRTACRLYWGAWRRRRALGAAWQPSPQTGQLRCPGRDPTFSNAS